MKRKLMSYFNCPRLDFLFSKKDLQGPAMKSETYLLSPSSSTGKASLSQSKYIYWPDIFYTEEKNTYSEGIQKSLKWHSARHCSNCFQIQKTYWPEPQISSCLVESKISRKIRNSQFFCLCPVRMCWIKCSLSKSHHSKEWFGLWCRNRFYSLMQNLTWVCIYWWTRKTSYANR